MHEAHHGATLRVGILQEHDFVRLMGGAARGEVNRFCGCRVGGAGAETEADDDGQECER